MRHCTDLLQTVYLRYFFFLTFFLSPNLLFLSFHFLSLSVPVLLVYCTGQVYRNTVKEPGREGGSAYSHTPFSKIDGMEPANRRNYFLSIYPLVQNVCTRGIPLSSTGLTSLLSAPLLSFHVLTFKHLHLFLDFLVLLCFPYPSTLPTFSPLFISLYRFLLTYLFRLFSPSLSPRSPSPLPLFFASRGFTSGKTRKSKAPSAPFRYVFVLPSSQRT